MLTRDNKPTNELQRSVEKFFKGTKLVYTEAYYLDCEVDENTGTINKNTKVRHYTKAQINRNLKALKSSYLISKGAVSPNEIIEFRGKYRIAASTLSMILGFSKNTISNIENDGVTSLPSGRLIKVCLNNLEILRAYISNCDAIDDHKKNELHRSLLQC